MAKDRAPGTISAHDHHRGGEHHDTAHTDLDRRGDVSDADLRAVREAGHGDAEIAEIVGHVALNVFTNYFNRLARTSIDL